MSNSKKFQYIAISKYEITQDTNFFTEANKVKFNLNHLDLNVNKFHDGVQNPYITTQLYSASPRNPIYSFFVETTESWILDPDLDQPENFKI